jgi:hypothetical protein
LINSLNMSEKKKISFELWESSIACVDQSRTISEG